MNKKSVLIMVLAMMLASMVSVVGTIAWLSDTTDEVKNTFTVGDVSFGGSIGGGLDEVKTNNLGEEDETVSRVTENEYKLMPGITYAKDPTIHLDPESEPCYVRAKVTVTEFDKIVEVAKRLYDDTALTELQIAEKITACVLGYKKPLWEDSAKTIKFADTNNDGKNDTVTYEFRVREIVVPGDDKTLNGESVDKSTESVSEYNGNYDNTFDIVLFSQIKMPDNLTDEDLEGLKEMKINVIAHAIQAESFEDADEAWAAFDQAGAN